MPLGLELMGEDTQRGPLALATHITFVQRFQRAVQITRLGRNFAC